MPTLFHIDGWEHQTISANKLAGGVGTGIVDILGNAAALSIDTTIKRTGNASLKSVQDGVTAARWQNDFVTPTQTLVLSAYIRYTTAPSAASRIFQGAGPAWLLRSETSGQLTVFFNIAGTTSATTSSSFADGEWHLIDVYVNTTGTTWTIDWYVDLVAQSQASVGSQVATNMTGVSIGTTQGNNTLTFWIDDFILSATAGDFPIGGHKVLALLPEADDTTASSYGTNVMEQGDGTDLSSSNQGWQYLDEWPVTTGTNNADTVTQAADGATNQVTVDFDDTAETVIWGADMIVGLQSDGTPVNNGTARARFSDATTLNIFSGDQSENVAHYRRLHLTDAKVDSQSELNGLQAQVGLSSDAAPDPEWLALIVQYAVPSVVSSAGQTFGEGISRSNALAVILSAAQALGDQILQGDGAVSVGPVTILAAGQTLGANIVRSNALELVFAGGQSMSDQVVQSSVLNLVVGAAQTIADTLKQGGAQVVVVARGQTTADALAQANAGVLVLVNAAGQTLGFAFVHGSGEAKLIIIFRPEMVVRRLFDPQLPGVLGPARPYPGRRRRL